MKTKILIVLMTLASLNTYADEQGDAARAQIQRQKDLRTAQSNLNSAKLAEARCADKKSPECIALLNTVNEAQAQFDSVQTSVSEADDAAKLKTISDGEANRSSAESCTKHAEEVKKGLPIATSQNENLDGANGSALMKKCVELSGNNMRTIGKNRNWENWKAFIDASPECIAANPKCNGDKPIEQIEQAKKDKCAQVAVLAAKCDAAAFLIEKAGRDWTSADDVKTPDVKGGTPVITCKGFGIETLDYAGCVKFVQNGDIMEVAQQAINAGQTLYYQDKTMTAQANATQSGDANGTASLQALHDGLKSQQDIMTQRAALDTGKLAALAAYYMDMPTTDSLTSECKNYTVPDSIKKSATESGGKVGGLDSTCSLAVNSQPGFALIVNQQPREQMKAKLVQVGVNVGTDAVMAGLMAKQANSVSDAIAKVDAFKPIDPLAPATTDLQSTYCQTNPGDAKCLTGGLDRTLDGLGDNVVTFGDGGTGTSYANTNPYVDPAAAAAAAAAAGTGSVTSVGSIVPSASLGSGLADKSDPAKISAGGAPASGGGGGGSGGGVGGGGGGGSLAAPAAGGVSAAIQGRTPTYGGGTGTLSMMGGNGINRSKSAAKDDSNPFGKLFNKDGNKSSVVNFRDLASQKVGDKNDNLFDMISKRYTTVNTDKRLLEYELAK